MGDKSKSGSPHSSHRAQGLLDFLLTFHVLTQLLALLQLVWIEPPQGKKYFVTYTVCGNNIHIVLNHKLRRLF